jgi:hypothetical protein
MRISVCGLVEGLTARVWRENSTGGASGTQAGQSKPRIARIGRMGVDALDSFDSIDSWLKEQRFLCVASS